MSLADFFRAKQQRIAELTGFKPLWTIWDREVPDARVRDPKKRGQYWHPVYGAMTQVHCTVCTKPGPFAVSETLEKVFYVCNRCTLDGKAPQHAIMVPGTANI